MLVARWRFRFDLVPSLHHGANKTSRRKYELKNFEIHPIADIFPQMSEEDYLGLRTDIEKNGLQSPITLFEGQILDGRHRYRACEELNIIPTFQYYNGNNPLSYIVSLNLKRRHLTASQRAVLAVELLPAFEKEAKQRQGTRTDLTEKVPESEAGEAREKAARLLEINPHFISDIKRIKQQAPELLEEIKRGEKTITKAKRELVKRSMGEVMPLPQNKYRVIYADPPWKYGNSGLDDYGHAERHYPVMTISELCALPVKDIVEENSALFLWVTSPLLEESFSLIKAWGFEYKTSFVWDKVRHNFGYYNSVRHEFLLICTRGSCTPENTKLHDSVITIERSDKHSQKPEYFRKLIEELYPSGKKIELFAREKSAGWDIWGNQV